MDRKRITKRGDDPRVCPTCRKGGFRVSHRTSFGRPLFICSLCDAIWTSGRDGLPYLPHAMKEGMDG